MKSKFGQSIVEVVFAVGVVGLVLSGVIALVVKSVNSNSKAMTRDKAVELGNVVMEGLVAEQRNDPASFWALSNVSDETMGDFAGYTYSVSFNKVTDGNCDSVRADCAQVDATVSWQAEGVKTATFSRLFRR